MTTQSINLGRVRGVTPHIGANKNWFIGTTDTGIRAEGIDGQFDEALIARIEAIEARLATIPNFWVGTEDEKVIADIPKGTITFKLED